MLSMSSQIPDQALVGRSEYLKIQTYLLLICVLVFIVTSLIVTSPIQILPQTEPTPQTVPPAAPPPPAQVSASPVAIVIEWPLQKQKNSYRQHSTRKGRGGFSGQNISQSLQVSRHDRALLFETYAFGDGFAINRERIQARDMSHVSKVKGVLVKSPSTLSRRKYGGRQADDPPPHDAR